MGMDELAAWSGVSRQAIYNAERGAHKIRPRTLAALAHTLGIPRSVLLHVDPADAPEKWRNYIQQLPEQRHTDQKAQHPA